jgi:hypothetical protein
MIFATTTPADSAPIREVVVTLDTSPADRRAPFQPKEETR